MAMSAHPRGFGPGLDDAVAGRAQVDDVQVPPRDTVGRHDQVVDVRRGAPVAGIWAGGVLGARTEDATNGHAVRVVGHRPLRGAVARRGEHDGVAMAGIDPTRAGTPELLAGEDRRVVDRGGAVRCQDAGQEVDTDAYNEPRDDCPADDRLAHTPSIP